MKELSIEEKARRYDEAIEIAKDINNEQRAQPANVMTRVFPELKENEDEKTKRILHSISSKMSFHLRDIFTEEEFQCFDTWSYVWLKKQGEQKSSWSEEDENRFNNLIFLVECSDENEPTKKGFIDFINRLKSLRPQPHWMPSDEQIKAIRLARSFVTDDFDEHPALSEILVELEEQLKKLREE